MFNLWYSIIHILFLKIQMQRNSTFQSVIYNIIQQKKGLIYYYTIIEMVLKRSKIQQRNKVICLVFVSPEWKILQNGLEAHQSRAP